MLETTMFVGVDKDKWIRTRFEGVTETEVQLPSSNSLPIVTKKTIVNEMTVRDIPLSETLRTSLANLLTDLLSVMK